MENEERRKKLLNAQRQARFRRKRKIEEFDVQTEWNPEFMDEEEQRLIKRLNRAFQLEEQGLTETEIKEKENKKAVEEFRKRFPHAQQQDIPEWDVESVEAFRKRFSKSQDKK